MSAVKYKFFPGQKVFHKKTGHVYIIIGVPSEGWTIEKTLEPAYVYIRADGQDPRKWIRPESETEDGRYTNIS